MGENNKHYFQGGNFFERFLRFFNLLEPGKMVLSLSKIAVYCSFALVIYVLIHMPDQLEAVLGSIAAFGTSTGNYAYRRYNQFQHAQLLNNQPSNNGGNIIIGNDNGTLPPYGKEPNEG